MFDFFFFAGRLPVLAKVVRLDIAPFSFQGKAYICPR
jgi:hypothetical protein